MRAEIYKRVEGSGGGGLGDRTGCCWETELAAGGLFSPQMQAASELLTRR